MRRSPLASYPTQIYTAIMFVCACVVAPTVHASFFEDYMIDPEDGNMDASRYLSEVPLGFLPVPVLITEPAVGYGLGITGIFFHESEKQSKQETDTSADNRHSILPENISIIAAAATENGSKGGGIGHMGFWRNDTLRYKGFLLYPDFNLDFYSFNGNTLPRAIELNLTGPAAVQELKMRVGSSRWMLGARQTFRRVNTQLAEGITLPNPNFENVVNDYLATHIGQRTTTSGLGVLTEYDSRDNPMSPQSGYNYLVKYTFFADAFGSDIEYDSYQFKGLNYWRLSDQFNLALRLQYDGIRVDDEVSLPSYVPPSIDLRGVAAVRYQGNAVALAEIELTWKATYRWRFNTFTGTGRAANSIDDLRTADAANNYGAGVRYLIARRYGFTMGADVARGPEESAFYIQAGSTW